ncbi:diacylglycerol kinase family protein [Nocardia sp. NPDC004068]|uniref:diacylglycerol kinase family protein n=1 Tax=Nocardia sp. NPDC004068 TaxID=3364303 RepID=UPI003699FD80
MSVRSVLLVTNPLSGHGKGLTAAAPARARLTERGIRVTEVRGATAAESTSLIRAALTGDDPPDAVACAGGDGLICITLQALADNEVPLGLIPGGTGNDLARELAIPDHDPIAAADIIAAGRTRPIDLGLIEPGPRPETRPPLGTGPGEAREPEFGGDPLPEPLRFATVAGTGFDARVTLRANRMRYPKGPLRYTLAAVAELAGGLAVPYRIELAGATGQSEVVETDAIMVAVGNTHSYGGGMMICPDAVIDDGLLEVSVIGAMSRLEMMRLLPALSAGKRVDHPALRQYRAAAVTLRAPGAPATADGEPAGRLPATFRALPAAQHILVP